MATASPVLHRRGQHLLRPPLAHPAGADQNVWGGVLHTGACSHAGGVCCAIVADAWPRLVSRLVSMSGQVTGSVPRDHVEMIQPALSWAALPLYVELLANTAALWRRRA